MDLITKRISNHLRLSMRLYPVYLLKWLTFDINVLHIMTMARRRLKVKVIGQGLG